MSTTNTIVVTRHPALVQYLQEIGITTGSEPVHGHITDPAILRGKHVIGVLPLSLAASASTITEVPLSLTPEDRGKELSIERVREIAGQPQTYVISPIEVHDEAQRAAHWSGEFGFTWSDDEAVASTDKVKRNRNW